MYILPISKQKRAAISDSSPKTKQNKSRCYELVAGVAKAFVISVQSKVPQVAKKFRM